VSTGVSGRLRQHRKNLLQGVGAALSDESRELGRLVRGDAGDVVQRDSSKEGRRNVLNAPEAIAASASDPTGRSSRSSSILRTGAAARR